MHTIEQLEAAVAEHGSQRAAAAALGVNESTVRRRLKGAGKSSAERTTAGPEKAGATIDHAKGEAVLVGRQSALDTGKVEDLVRENGLDPADWEIVTTTLNKWQGPVAGGGAQWLRQVKVTLRSLRALEAVLRPAALPPLEALPTARPFESTTGALGILTGCWQYPYQDPVFEGLFERFLADVRPAFGIDHGDGMDLANISRHADDPAVADPAQASVDAYGLALYRRRLVSPGTAWRLLFGNHDIRLMTEALQRAERLAGIRPAQWPGEKPQAPLLAIERALRTDELGVDVIAPPHGSAKYAAAECVVSPRYLAIHGVKTDANAAARLTVQQYGCSISMAHTHRQRMFSVRLQRGPLPAIDATGVEVGCGMEIGGRGSLYADRPDWANGAFTVTLGDDGEPFFEPLRYRAGVLAWRDYRWKA